MRICDSTSATGRDAEHGKASAMGMGQGKAMGKINSLTDARVQFMVAHEGMWAMPPRIELAQIE